MRHFRRRRRRDLRRRTLKTVASCLNVGRGASCRAPTSVRIDWPPWRAERFDAKTPRLQPFGPAIRLKAGLRHQMAHELAGVGKWRQTLGRNRARRLPAARISPSRSGSSALASSDSLPAGMGRGWERIDTSRRSAAKFGWLERRKARVGKGRLRRIGERVVDKRPMRLERTDAAAKPVVLGQGDEGRAPRRKRGRRGVEARRRGLAAGPRRRPRAAMQAESRRSRSASASRAEAAYSSAKAP